MRTIAKLVQGIIVKSPFLSEALTEGIVNISELARKIKPQVEKNTMETVSLAAIGAALRRNIIKNSRRSGLRYATRIKNILLHSDLVEFILVNNVNLLKIYQDILKRVSPRRSDLFFNIIRGNYQSIVVISSALEKDLRKILPSKNIKKRIGNLSAMTLKLPEGNIFLPGVYYPFLKALAWNGISFVEIISLGNELSLFFEDKDIARAFATIKSVIT